MQLTSETCISCFFGKALKLLTEKNSQPKNNMLHSRTLTEDSSSGNGEGSGNPLQYSYLENPMDGGAW